MAFGNQLLNISEDIKFDLEQIRLSFQEKDRLNDDQNDKLKSLPKKLREEKEEEILKEKRNKKKEEMRRWALQLEESVAMADYPPEIKSRILSLTERMKYTRFTLSNDEVERQVAEIKRQIEVFENKKALGLLPEQQKSNKVGEAVLAGAVGAVVAGAVLGPYIQVRYTEEGYKKLTDDYVENKILSELRSGDIKQIPTSKSYPKKTGAMYSSRSNMARRDMDEKILKEMAKVAGVSPEKIEELEQKNKIRFRALKRYTLGKNEELAQEEKTMEADVAASDITVGLLRQERRAKAEALERLEAQKDELTRASTPETKKAVEAQIAAINERIAERRREELAMALFTENLSKNSLEAREKSLSNKEKRTKDEEKELVDIRTRLPKLNERLAMHRIEADTLGLKVNGFEKALAQRGVSRALLDKAKTKGRVSMEALTDQLMIMAKTGIGPIMPTQTKSNTPKKVRVDGKKMKIALENEGISGKLKKEIQDVRTAGKTTKSQEKMVGKAVATNRKEPKAKTKSIRLRINPQNETERMAASQLKNVITDRNPKAKVKEENGFKEILKEVSKSTENAKGVEEKTRSRAEWLAAAQKAPQRTPEENQRMNEALQREAAERGGFKGILKENSALVKSKQRVTEVPQRLLEEKIHYRDAG